MLHLLAGCALALAARPAGAECSSVVGAIANGNRWQLATVPPNPTLTAFVRGDETLTVTVDGRPVPFSKTELPFERGSLLTPYSLHIRSGAGTHLEVHLGGSYATHRYAFTIDQSWKRKAATLHRVARVRPPFEMCPALPDAYKLYTDGNALAYRVEWDEGAVGRSSIIAPLRRPSGPSYLVDSDSGPTPANELFIGAETGRCQVELPLELMDSGRSVRLVALYPDGSELPVATVALAADTPEEPLFGGTIHVARHPEPSYTDERKRPRSTHDSWLTSVWQILCR